MTHPAVYAITLGIALGAAVIAYFAAAKFHQENPHNHGSYGYRCGRSESESFGSSHPCERDICTICQETLDKGQSTELRCQHKFHRGCLATLKKVSKVCPNCRQVI